jgi:hypothetical protein
MESGKETSIPQKLRSYVDLGLDLDWGDGEEAKGECPFCGKENKFSIEIETGMFKCWSGSCDERGNNFSFVEKVMTISKERDQGGHEELAEEKRLLFPETLSTWGIFKSFINQQWLIPGYNEKGKLQHAYRYTNKILWSLSGMKHKIHGVNLMSKKRKNVYLCEGVWDGMALWEVLRRTKAKEGNLYQTSKVDLSLAEDSNVLAVPGCNSFSKNWYKLFSGKNAILCFDNDHKRKADNGSTIKPAGLEGMTRIAKMLGTSEKPPNSISFISWKDNTNGQGR